MTNNGKTSAREVASAFIDTMQSELDAANNQIADLTTRVQSQAKTIDEYETDIDNLKSAAANNEAFRQASDEYWRSQLMEANKQSRLHLRYSVELSGQLRFVVAGCVRALKLAATVQALYDEQSAEGTIPDVPEADIAQLEELMSRIAQGAPRTDQFIADNNKAGTAGNGGKPDKHTKPPVNQL